MALRYLVSPEGRASDGHLPPCIECSQLSVYLPPTHLMEDVMHYGIILTFDSLIATLHSTLQEFQVEYVYIILIGITHLL